MENLIIKPKLILLVLKAIVTTLNIKKTEVLLSWYATMPRLDPATRNNANSRLKAGESQNEIARTLNVNQSTIFQQTAKGVEDLA
jgi:hypothetical protein